MISVLADQQIELAYYRDPLMIDALDEEQILDDLTGGLAGAPPCRKLMQIRLTDYDHLVIATDRREGRAVAILAAQDGKTTHEEFLLLEQSFVRPDARDNHLMRRMAAALLLRIAGLGSAPTVIAACTSDPGWFAVLQAFGRRFTGSACFPQPKDAPIQLRSAALAQRIARSLHPHLRFETATGALRGALAARGGMTTGYASVAGPASQAESCISCLLPADQLLMLIDLRTETETGIVEDARKIYRAR